MLFRTRGSFGPFIRPLPAVWACLTLSAHRASHRHWPLQPDCVSPPPFSPHPPRSRADSTQPAACTVAVAGASAQARVWRRETRQRMVVCAEGAPQRDARCKAELRPGHRTCKARSSDSKLNHLRDVFGGRETPRKLKLLRFRPARRQDFGREASVKRQLDEACGKGNRCLVLTRANRPLQS